MSRLDDRLTPYLQDLKSRDGYRTMTSGVPEGAARIRRGERRLINFSSNDYLDLAHHPELIKRAVEWTERWGAGAGASRLVTGTHDAHQAAEEKLARLKGTEAALIFNSGYQANASVLPALLDKGMLGGEPKVFTDRLIHASLHHGLAAQRQIRFRHNDLEHLDSLLKKHAGAKSRPFIITESVFSMDGDRADLAALCDVAHRHGAFLYVDEAHATGVLGPKGMGLSGGVPARIDLIMGTFSKALGGFGAYVACSAPMRDYLVNRSAGFIYSTALPPGVLGAMDAALDLVPGMDAERARLHGHADTLRRALAEAGISAAGSSTQIVPAVIGSSDAALAASRLLEERGILGIAIRPPTVAEGTSRLRFAMTSAHTDEDIRALTALIPEIAP
jgi:8-amino-7-oxononanoate synthase